MLIPDVIQPNRDPSPNVPFEAFIFPLDNNIHIRAESLVLFSERIQVVEVESYRNTGGRTAGIGPELGVVPTGEGGRWRHRTDKMTEKEGNDEASQSAHTSPLNGSLNQKARDVAFSSGKVPVESESNWYSLAPLPVALWNNRKSRVSDR